MSDNGQQAGGEPVVTATGEQQGSDRQGAEAGGQQAGDEPVFSDLMVGEAWGESITKERAAELEAQLQAWEGEADHGKRKGPLDNGPGKGGVRLTGAEGFWLAARTWAGSSEVRAVTEQAERVRAGRPDIPQRVPVNLSVLNLSGASLGDANLSRAELGGTTLDNRTKLEAMIVTDTPHWYTALVKRIRHEHARGSVSVADIHWNEADLTVVDWSSTS